jgi:hypothetical protein
MRKENPEVVNCRLTEYFVRQMGNQQYNELVYKTTLAKLRKIQ